MKGKTPDTIHGKIFESEIKGTMTGIENRLPIRFSKVVDSAIAGNIISKADSDFRLQVAGQLPGQPYVFHIEAKATVTDKLFESNFRAFVKGSQNASMVLNARAGASCCYFFKRVNEGCFEVWDAVLVSRSYPHLRSKVEGHAAFTIAMPNLGAFMLKVCENPAYLADALLRTRT